MSEAKLITAMVLSTIMLRGEKVKPGTESEPVVVELTESEFNDLSKFDAVVEVEIEEIDEPTKPPAESDSLRGSAEGANSTESAGGTETPPSSEGQEAAVTTEQIVDAIGQLTSEDYTNGGKPEVKALEALLKAQITADQRDEAWKQCQDAKGSK